MSFGDWEPWTVPLASAGPARSPSGSLGVGDRLPPVTAFDQTGRMRSLGELAVGRPVGVLLLCGDDALDAAAVACAAALELVPREPRQWIAATPVSPPVDAGMSRGPGRSCDGEDGPAVPVLVDDLLHRLVLGDCVVDVPVAVVTDAARRIVAVFDVVEPAWMRRHATRALAERRPHERPRQLLSAAPVLALPDVLDDRLRRRLLELVAPGGGPDAGGRTGGAPRRSAVPPALHHELAERIDTVVVPELARLGWVAARSLRDAAITLESGVAAASPGADRCGPGSTLRLVDGASCRFRLFASLGGRHVGGELRLPEFGPHRLLLRPGTVVVTPAATPVDVRPVRRGWRALLTGELHDHRDARRPVARV